MYKFLKCYDYKINKKANLFFIKLYYFSFYLFLKFIPLAVLKYIFSAQNFLITTLL